MLSDLDLDKIDEEEKCDGFYAVATNLDDDVRTIIAHFMICYTALLIHRPAPETES